MLDTSSVDQESSLSERSGVKMENHDKTTQDNLKTKMLVKKSGNNVFQFGMIDAQQSVELKQSYMENEEFLARNCYCGG